VIVMPRVLVRETIAPAGVELLRERFDVDVDGDSELAEIIDRYDAIVVRSATKLTADLIDRAARLKVIGRAGVGVDNVDVDAATRRGIVVANAPESTVVSAAEHTIGLLVALARNIPQAHAALKAGRWARRAYGGVELAGKTLGVLGFGRIGQQVARRAGGLGMHVVAYDPYVSRDRFRELGVERVETPAGVYAVADFITLHLPLTAETRASVDADAFAQMRDGVRLVNAARGELVDEPALLAALRSGKVAGAALDVFSAEPYSGPLLELDNVVVTPHLAASTDEAQDRAGVIVAEQVAAALEGGVVTNAVNIPVSGAEELEALRPFIPLAAKLGRIAMELAEGRADEIVVTSYGGLADYDTRLLTVAVLNGAFHGRADRPVNYVNAPLIAQERGIEVREERSRSSRDFTNLLRVEIRSAGEQTRVAGTLIGRDNRQWLVSALGFELDLELAPLLVLFRYDDVPGVIGRVGTLFGQANVNIANMTVSRTRRGGKALMVLTIDSMPPPELVERIRAEGFDDARVVELGPVEES
jgi:D-3-phosphoglycerate dehydrogenase